MLEILIIRRSVHTMHYKIPHFLQTVLILEDDDEADLANLDFYFDGTNGSKAMKVTSSSLAIARLSTSNNSEMLINGKASLKIDLFWVPDNAVD